MLGQARAVWSVRRYRLLAEGNGRQQLLDPAYIGADVLQAELQLAVIQALGPLPILLAL